MCSQPALQGAHTYARQHRTSHRHGSVQRLSWKASPPTHLLHAPRFLGTCCTTQELLRGCKAVRAWGMVRGLLGTLRPRCGGGGIGAGPAQQVGHTPCSALRRATTRAPPHPEEQTLQKTNVKKKNNRGHYLCSSPFANPSLSPLNTHILQQRAGR